VPRGGLSTPSRKSSNINGFIATYLNLCVLLPLCAIFKGHFELIHPVSLHPFHWRRVVIVRILGPCQRASVRRRAIGPNRPKSTRGDSA
jgi:hypothetical protein